MKLNDKKLDYDLREMKSPTVETTTTAKKGDDYVLIESTPKTVEQVESEKKDLVEYFEAEIKKLKSTIESLEYDSMGNERELHSLKESSIIKGREIASLTGERNAYKSILHNLINKKK